MRTLVLSYDFDGQIIGNGEALSKKRRRDGDRGETLMIVWSVRRARLIYGEVTIESVPAFAGRFRPLYDHLFIVLAPYAARGRFERIVIADFALAPAALITSLVRGGVIEFRVNGLPREIARLRGPFHMIYQRISEFLWKRVPYRYVVINETTRAYLMSIGIPESRVFVRVPDTITPDRDLIAAAQPGRMRQKWCIPPEERIIFSAGRLEKEKGFDDLIDVFAASGVRGFLVIAGEGREHAALSEHAHRLGIARRVIFAGSLERKDLWDAYADADAFVLLSRTEALGLVVWEAMYAGLPVIGRPVGGIAESIGDNERGLVWDRTDGPSVFAELLQKSFDRDAATEERMRRARAYVEEKLSGTVR